MPARIRPSSAEPGRPPAAPHARLHSQDVVRLPRGLARAPLARVRASQAPPDAAAGIPAPRHLGGERHSCSQAPGRREAFLLPGTWEERGVPAPRQRAPGVLTGHLLLARHLLLLARQTWCRAWAGADARGVATAAAACHVSRVARGQVLTPVVSRVCVARGLRLEPFLIALATSANIGRSLGPCEADAACTKQRRSCSAIGVTLR